MAKETVQAVRQAEEKAAQIEKEAVVKGEMIVQNAKEEANNLQSSMSKDILLKAEEDLKNVQLQGNKLMEAAVQKAEKEIILLKEVVKSKEQAAIDLVLTEVI
jgi:V/A-type H+-transporting ATPase subunit G/H